MMIILILNLNIPNIRSYIEAAQLIEIMNDNPNNANRIIRITHTNKLIFGIKSLIIVIIVYSCGLLINQIYNSVLSIIFYIF